MISSIWTCSVKSGWLGRDYRGVCENACVCVSSKRPHFLNVLWSMPCGRSVIIPVLSTWRSQLNVRIYDLI